MDNDCRQTSIKNIIAGLQPFRRTIGKGLNYTVRYAPVQRTHHPQTLHMKKDVATGNEGILHPFPDRVVQHTEDQSTHDC